MSIHPVQILADGTHRYKGRTKYKPIAPEDRKYGVNKPDDPRAVRHFGVWLLPLDVLDDGARVMPATRADSEAYDHMSTNLLCHCDVCSSPYAERWRRKWRRDHGLRNQLLVRDRPKVSDTS